MNNWEQHHHGTYCRRDLPREKRLEIALTYIYGVGRTRAAETLAATGVSPDTRVKDATEEELVKAS